MSVDYSDRGSIHTVVLVAVVKKVVVAVVAILVVTLNCVEVDTYTHTHTHNLRGHMRITVKNRPLGTIS